MKLLGFVFFSFVAILGLVLIDKYSGSYQGALGVLCLSPIWGIVFFSAAVACVWPEKKKTTFTMARKPKRKW